jgi:N-acetylglucosaminyldiphosphoundecaprenol N-acetyl-beta-D-mannosaminyltransferase
MIKHSNILGVRISAIKLSAALDQIEAWIASRDRQRVHVCNVQTIMECRRDTMLRLAINQAGLTAPDGMPLVWLSRLAGHHQVTRVYGPDLMLALMERSIAKGYRHYFYGGAEGVADRLAEVLRQKYPGVQIVGADSPPFREGYFEEDQAVIAGINARKPDIIWVGLGTPKQDWWIIHHRNRLQAAALIAVGAAFDFHTGRVPQAPRWMMGVGLEWLFRLCTEPRRLWKRYLINNPLFILLSFTQILGLKHYELE